MKARFFLPFALAPCISSAATIAYGVTGIYDENTIEAASVDTNSSGNSLASTNPNDVLGFSSSVAAAFAANAGGVIDFDSQATQSGDDNTGLTVSYGGGKTLEITSSTTNANNRIFASDFTSLGAISGTNGLISSNSNDTAWRMTFDSITGGIPGEIVTSAGFTVLSRNSNAQDLTVQWFIDGETDLANAAFTDVESIAAGANNDDTFFAYTAPNGSAITSFRFTFGGTESDKRLGIDDLGFITNAIPEPSSALLTLLGTTAILLRRRR